MKKKNYAKLNTTLIQNLKKKVGEIKESEEILRKKSKEIEKLQKEKKKMTVFDMIPNNSANIVISPPLEGKRLFIYKLIGYKLKKKEPVLYIATDASPEDIKKEMVKHKIFFGDAEAKDLLKFIDCYSHHVGDHKPGSKSLKRVSGPLALNEISIALSDAEKEFIKLNDKHTVIFDSISTMLMYSNPQAVGRFVQVTIAKVKKAGGTIIFTLEEGMHKPDVMVTMEHLMNSIIHVKHEKNKIFVKSEGLDSLNNWAEI